MIDIGAESGSRDKGDLERDPSLALDPGGLRLSVVVPAHNAASYLAVFLDALAASTIPRDQWELIVVDDSSSDSTPDIAEPRANRVIRAAGGALVGAGDAVQGLGRCLDRVMASGAGQCAGPGEQHQVINGDESVLANAVGAA